MINLVITHIMMPGMNSYWMSLSYRRPTQIPLIITISGYSPRSVTGLEEEELEGYG